MKSFLFIAALGVTAALTGCTSTSCDSADTAGCKADDTSGGNGGGGGTPLLQNITLGCSGSTCSYLIESDGTIGTAELYLAETGDPTSTCGPGKSLSDCGFWEEHHDAFSYDSASSFGGDAFGLTVDLVTDYTQQANNESTLFDLNDATISNQLTVMAIITDAGGAYADCAVYGDDISYYSDMCSNSWN